MSNEFFKPEDFHCSEILTDAGLATLANRLLKERGVVVYRYKNGNDNPRGADWSPEIDEAFGGVKKYSHTALLIGITPIAQPDTAESLIRELGNFCERSYPLMSYPDDEKYRAELAAKAKAFLEKKK